MPSTLGRGAKIILRRSGAWSSTRVVKVIVPKGISVRLGGQVLKQQLRVPEGATAKATFVWPAGTDMASAGTRAVQ